MNIGPYTPGIVRPNYKAPRLNEELATKVLGAKQGEFNAAYQSIQDLKQQALNIQFLHPTGKEKIDGYNSEINDYFGKLKDYGDLTNPEVQQGYVGMFSKIADDTDLLNLYKTDKQYQNQLQSIKTMKTAKDPNKAGYSAINEAVWYNGEGGLKDYISNKDASTASQMKPAEYTPYYDYRPELSSIVKDIKFDGTKVTYRDGAGNLHTEETKGVSQEKVKANLLGRFSGMAKKQLDIEADFSYMQSKDNPETRRQIYDADIINGKASYERASEQVEKTKARIAILEGKPDKQDEVDELRSNLTKYEQLEQDAFKQANTPWAEYQDLPENVLRDKFKQLHTDARYDQISNGIAYRISSSDMKTDDAFWKSKELGLDYAKFDADTKYKQQMFGLAVAKEVRESKQFEKENMPEVTPPVIVPIAGESNSSLDLSQLGTKVNEWNTKARTLDEREIASIATDQMQASGSLIKTGTIEETFLKKYMKQNPDRFDGKTNAEKTEILKAAREEFRSGKSSSPEYQELVLGDQVRNAMNDIVNEAWTKAKEINQVEAIGEDGKFWTSNGTEIDPNLMQTEVATYIKDKNLEFVIGGIQPNVSDNSVSGKGKETVIYNNRQTQLANINAAREAMKEDGKTGQPLLGLKDIDWESPFVVNPEGAITYTPMSDEAEKGKYVKGDPVTIKTERVKTLDNNMMMLYNLGKPIKIPHNGVDIYISPDKANKSTTVVYKWGNNRESTTISNGSYYDIGTIKQLATDYIDKKKQAYPNLF